MEAASGFSFSVWYLIFSFFSCNSFAFSSIGNLNVQTVAILGYLEPLSAVVFSVLFLHETMVPIQVAGAIMVLGGAIGVELQLPGANGGKMGKKNAALKRRSLCTLVPYRWSPFPL